ncbi:putative acetylcholinesterase [Apostichopus japonicus]|uniref:Putative acetylcholinesterase n=1 Tax=Stichopus japonicus TaxID=307972 RepID=A0A2G8KN25_STIJA|nr:putative acetylcholinesterase [Apostichopus japonicus]
MSILQSGNTMSPWGQETEINNARSDAFLLGRAAGCGLLSSSRDLADCLRGIDAYRLTVAINAVLLQTTNNIPLGPVVDGDFFLSKSRSLLNMGQFKRCNVILGSTADDGTIVTARAYPSELLADVPVSDYETFTEKLAQFTYTYSNDVIVRAIQQQYVDWKERDDDSTNYFYDFVNVATDEAFLCPAEYMGRAYSKAGLSVYRALFNHKPEQSTWPDRLVKWRGVAHSEDNPFTFGRGFNPDRGHTFSSDEATLSLAMMEYYTNFAKTGNPNQNSDGDVVESEWEPFTLTEPYMKELKPKLGNLIGFRASYCAMHNNLIPDLITNTGT